LVIVQLIKSTNTTNIKPNTNTTNIDNKNINKNNNNKNNNNKNTNNTKSSGRRGLGTMRAGKLPQLLDHPCPSLVSEVVPVEASTIDDWPLGPPSQISSYPTISPLSSISTPTSQIVVARWPPQVRCSS